MPVRSYTDAQKRERRVPFRELRLDIGDDKAADGTLRELENMRWAGPPEAPYLTFVPPDVPWFDASAFAGTVRAVGIQRRNRRGEWSSQADSSFDRHIVVTSSHIYLVDEANAFRVTEVYDFGSDDTTREAQFAEVNDVVVIAVSASGAPEFLLQLRDDECFSFNGPSLPEVGAAITDVTGEDDGLEQGFYAYRYAYELVDGSIGAISDVRILNAPNTRNAVEFVILRIIGLTNNWRKLLRRVVVYMTQKSEDPAPGDTTHISGLMDSPFFEVVSISEVEQGASASFADTNESILKQASLVDNSLFQHPIFAASVFAYNKRLLLGDVAYDFQEPLFFGAIRNTAGKGAPYFKGLSYARFEYSAGDTQSWECCIDAGSIETFTVQLGSFDFQIERWNGTGWDTTNCPAVNTSYDQGVDGGAHTRMRVKVTEKGTIGSSGRQDTQMTLDATGDAGFQAQQWSVVLSVGGGAADPYWWLQ